MNLRTVFEPPMDFGARSKRRHGTRSGYVSGCRCEPCVMANREWKRAWAGGVPLDDYLQQLREGRQKHGASAYKRGCRCVVCRTANSDAHVFPGYRGETTTPDTECAGCGRLFRGEYGLKRHHGHGCPGPVLTRFTTTRAKR